MLTQKVSEKGDEVEYEVHSGSTDTEEVTFPGLPVMPHTWVLELEYSLKYVIYSGHKYALYSGHKYVLLWWQETLCPEIEF